jgi:hypothetical protein
MFASRVAKPDQLTQPLPSNKPSPQHPRDIQGVLALTALSSPLLANSVWPYYFLHAYVLGPLVARTGQSAGLESST